MTRHSLILRTTAVAILPLMLIFSLFLFLAGHQEPGGGFIAALVAAGGFATYALAFGVPAARRLIRVDPIRLMAVGLALAFSAGLLGLLVGRPFMTGLWAMSIHQGTPVLFDLGVYVTVVGVVICAIFTLAEDES
jgi:multicomponent Na+:H+ antiporter subunit B